MYTILVFPDGKTWSTIDGCTIMVVNESDFKNLCEDRVDALDIEATVELDLVDFTNRRKA
jgi:hypothetical protein